jgi:hypothetical protein
MTTAGVKDDTASLLEQGNAPAAVAAPQGMCSCFSINYYQPVTVLFSFLLPPPFLTAA